MTTAKCSDKTFYVSFIDEGNCDINPHPQEIVARDLCHAMQKAAAIVPGDAVRVVVQEK